MYSVRSSHWPWIYIKFCQRFCDHSTEAYTKLQKVYRERSIGAEMLIVMNVLGNRIPTQLRKHGRCAFSCEGNHWIDICELSEDVQINCGSAQSVEDLVMRCMSAKVMPLLLSADKCWQIQCSLCSSFWLGTALFRSGSHHINQIASSFQKSKLTWRFQDIKEIKMNATKQLLIIPENESIPGMLPSMETVLD